MTEGMGGSAPAGPRSSAWDPRAAPREALWLLAVSAAVRLALALGTEITYDEAYYWTWSRQLGPGYFDHPPMVAWLIRLLGIRGSALLCGAATVVLVHGLAADLGGRPEVGWRAAALWSVLPASVLAGVFATPDAPLMLFWAGTLWALHRERWVLAGVLGGLSLLSKYTGALLLVPAVVACAGRGVRLSRVLLAVAAALLVFSPVVAWNAAHGWASFLFQLDHGLSGTPQAATASPGWRLLTFAGGQVAVGGLLFPLGLVWAVRERSSPAWLRAAFLSPVALFGIASLLAPGEANWASTAYLAPCAFLSSRAGLRWRASVLLGALVCLAGTSHLLLPVLRFQRDGALARTHGWRELEALGDERAAVVYAPGFGVAAEVAYHARVPVAVAGHSRPTQFDLWPRPALELGQDALFVSERDELPEKLARAFQAVEGPRVLSTGYRGRALHHFHVWRLRGNVAPPDLQRPPLPSGPGSARSFPPG